ncbi:hypothetical protein PIB30_080724 [Stylosanthes scabra]|uniref:Uncharacterized protein n=1 Tax=Stylosanthes scabra TaxID=79078 RepID=A0ABU6RRI7_9FABA|nr:hypothetical protein [Stylosanthes scabra]
MKKGMNSATPTSGLVNFQFGAPIAALFVATRSSSPPLRFYTNHELEYELRIITQTFNTRMVANIWRLMKSIGAIGYEELVLGCLKIGRGWAGAYVYAYN